MTSGQAAIPGKVYIVGQAYRDTAGKEKPQDEFLRWLAVDGLTIANVGGVRWRDYKSLKVVDPDTRRRIPAYMVLVTTETATQFHNPWDDFIDQNGGDILYWGDAKFREHGQRFNEFPGNSRLEAVNNLRLSRKLSMMPPILHFTKPSEGSVRFNGLCTLTGMQIRAACRGTVKKRQVWAAKIRNREMQVPIAGSDDVKLIEEIRSLTPYQFESFVVSLLEKIPEIIPGLNHRIIQTRRTGDHGVDFYGSFTLPAPIQYEISFVGQAKRFVSGVTPDEVSRLVARLGRGQ